MARLDRPGLREAIVLDLARVGSGAGPDIGLIAELHAAFPDLELLAGGGVRDAADLRALADAGAAGALVATALHPASSGVRDDASTCLTSAAATSAPVASCNPRQPGIPLSSSTYSPQQVDARVVGAQRLGGRAGTGAPARR